MPQESPCCRCSLLWLAASRPLQRRGASAPMMRVSATTKTAPRSRDPCLRTRPYGRGIPGTRAPCRPRPRHARLGCLSRPSGRLGRDEESRDWRSPTTGALRVACHSRPVMPRMPLEHDLRDFGPARRKSLTPVRSAALSYSLRAVASAPSSIVAARTSNPEPPAREGRAQAGPAEVAKVTFRRRAGTARRRHDSNEALDAAYVFPIGTLLQ